MLQAKLSSPTILVVDDEPAILRTLASWLVRNGLVVVAAQGGEAAVEVFRELDGGVAFVLLDVQMPGRWDGPRTLAELKRINPLIPAAFMSGDTGKFSTDDLLDLGALAVFPKPFQSVGELVTSLKDLMAIPHSKE